VDILASATKERHHGNPLRIRDDDVGTDFFEGPDHDIRWHKVDAEFNAFSARQLAATAALLFGRATYQLMAGYWPTATGGRSGDPIYEFAAENCFLPDAGKRGMERHPADPGGTPWRKCSG